MTDRIPTDYGFMPFSRKMVDGRDALWEDPSPFDVRSAWADLLFYARFVPGVAEGELLGRGEFVASVRFLAKRWRWGLGRVHRYLKRLEKLERIAERRIGHRGTVYALVNYDTYNQPNGRVPSQSGTLNGTAAEHPRNGSGTKRKKDKEGTTAESAVFLEAWALYPKRPNNNRAAAWEAWSARLNAGEDEQGMLTGTRAYAAWVAVNTPEPRYIKQASSFYGPKRHYLNDYDSPPAALSVLQGGQTSEERYAFLIGEAQRGMDMGDTAKYPDWTTYRARYWRGEKPKTNRGALRSAS